MIIHEAEIRILISDIAKIKNKLQALNAHLEYTYQETDHYYKPRKDSWKLDEKNLRIREWQFPYTHSEIYFSQNEIYNSGSLQFKKSVFPEGKVLLYKNSFETCHKLLESLGFLTWFEIKKKKGEIWSFGKNKYHFCIENIENLGYCAEIEIKNQSRESIRNMITKELELLEIDIKDVSPKPLSLIYLEKVISSH